MQTECCTVLSRLMYLPVLVSPRLKPFTSYQFRIKATNDIGDSEYSEESEAITTLQDGESDIRKNLLMYTLYAYNIWKNTVLKTHMIFSFHIFFIS